MFINILLKCGIYIYISVRYVSHTKITKDPKIFFLIPTTESQQCGAPHADTVMLQCLISGPNRITCESCELNIRIDYIDPLYLVIPAL